MLRGESMNSPPRTSRVSIRQPSAKTERLDSEEFVQLLRRNFWLIGAVVFLVMGGTYFYLSRQTPMYRAEAAMALTTSEVRISQVNTQMEVYDLTRARVETELDRLRSRNFVERVADGLDLFGDPTFLPESEGGPAVGSPDRAREVVDKVLGSYKLERSGESLVISIIAESTSPERAADIANAVVKAFVNASVESQTEGIERSVNYLREQISTIGEELTQAQMDLAAFIRDNQLDDAELSGKLRRERSHTASVIEVMDSRNEGDTAERQRLQADLDKMDAQLSSRTLQELQLARRNLGIELMNTRYETAVERLNQLEPQLDHVDADARQITVAEIPTEPFRPNIPTTMAMALPAGLILGFILALLRSTMSRQIWNGAQATHVSQLPNLGNLPRIPRSGLMRRLRPIAFVHNFPRSGFTEAMRSLLTVWAGQQARDTGPRVVMITSALPHEGKSTIAACLAAVAAQDAMRVLLIDFDTRRTGASRIVGAEGEPSELLDLTQGELSLDDALLPVDPECGFDFISFDQGTRLTPAVVTDFREKVLPQMVARYDLVIIDTPPALGLADAARLGAIADSTLIVLRSGKTPENALRHGVERLEDSGVTLGGTVVNDIEPRRYRQLNLGGSYAYY